MIEIQLPKGKWRYDERRRLGKGGFGAVYRGTSDNGDQVAIKVLEAGPVREMRIADFLLGHGLLHVIPILDAGYDEAAETNFIVMPMAEKSLQGHLDNVGSVSEAETISILDCVAAGLDEIGDIIHRDLKPGNVLFHDGRWKLADLGLARFAEASTSPSTMREFLTADYAAPEQWRGERPQKTTDVYALGYMIYAMLQGAPPFSGPDFSHLHRFTAPPALTASSHLKRLASACLAKSPDLRPSVQTVRNQLKIAADVARGGRAALAAAAAAVSERELLEETQRAERQRRDERREQLRAEAVRLLESIFVELETNILQDAPNIKIGTGLYTAGLKALSLGKASLEYGILFPSIKVNVYVNGLPAVGGRVGSREWDVIAGAFISVHTRDRNQRAGRSANLWFGRLRDSDDYRWWEVTYTNKEGKPEQSWATIPFGLDTISDFLSYFVAEDPRPITFEFVGEFIDRWIAWFSLIATGNDSEIDKAFPVPFQRQPVSAIFRPDKP
jgi:serine/threonine-protein kinase